MSFSRDASSSNLSSEKVIGVSPLTLRDKSLISRSRNRHHHNNNMSGYVPVHEDLHKMGLRGKKAILVGVLVTILYVLAFSNLILLSFFLSMLRIGLGMDSLEIIPENSLFKLYGKANLGKVYKKDGLFEGYKDEPLEIIGQQSKLAIDLISPSHDVAEKLFIIDEKKILIQKVQTFEIKNLKTGSEVFSTKNPYFSHSKGIQQLISDYASTSRMSSPYTENLVLRSDSYLRFKGNEGTKIEGNNILWSADKFLFLKSVNGSISINGTRGINIDMSTIAEAATGIYGSLLVSQFKVCVCMPSGKLFKVAVHVGQSSHSACKRINMAVQNNPCKLS